MWEISVLISSTQCVYCLQSQDHSYVVSTQTMDVRCQCEGLRQILSQFYCFPAHQHQPTMGHFWSLLSVFTQPSPTTIYCRLEHTETKAEKCLSIHRTISRGLLLEQDHNILHFTILWKQDTFGPCVDFHIVDLYLTVAWMFVLFSSYWQSPLCKAQKSASGSIFYFTLTFLRFCVWLGGWPAWLRGAE